MHLFLASLSRLRMVDSRNDTDIDFSRYQREPFSQDLIDQELHSQKKREFVQKHMNSIDLGWPESEVIGEQGHDEFVPLYTDSMLSCHSLPLQTKSEELRLSANSQTQTDRCRNEDTLPSIYKSQSTPIDVTC